MHPDTVNPARVLVNTSLQFIVRDLQATRHKDHSIEAVIIFLKGRSVEWFRRTALRYHQQIATSDQGGSQRVQNVYVLGFLLLARVWDHNQSTVQRGVSEARNMHQTITTVTGLKLILSHT